MISLSLDRRALLAGLSITALSATAVGGLGAARAASPLVERPRVVVEALGAGPDVVFMPGYACSREVWRETATRLAASRRVHLVQLRGFAGLAPPATTVSIWEPALADIADYMRTLSQPAFVGHSMGGATGLRLAIDHPQVVSKVLVVDSLPFYATIFNPAATAETVRPAARQIAGAMRSADPAQFAAMQAQSAAILVKSPAARERVVGWSVASDRATIATAIEELITTDLRPDLGKIRTPVTAAFAWDAAMGRSAEAHETFWRSQYAGLKDAKFARIDDSYHFVMNDQPARFAEVIDDFLNA